MAFILGFIVVPTYYAIYIVVDKDAGALKFVKEYKTKGHALQWISKSGEKSITYCIQQHYRRK